MTRRLILACALLALAATACRLPGGARQASLEATVAAQGTQLARLSLVTPAARSTVAPALTPPRTAAPPVVVQATAAQPRPTATNTTRPAPTNTSVPDFTKFAKSWGAHGFSMIIRKDGTGEATWRTYTWCGDVTDPKTPCDRTENNIIYPGGHANFRFLQVDGATIRGQALATTDPDTIPNGTVWLRLEKYGMATIGVGTEEMRALCGPDYADLAPLEVQQEFPCGA